MSPFPSEILQSKCKTTSILTKKWKTLFNILRKKGKRKKSLKPRSCHLRNQKSTSNNKQANGIKLIPLLTHQDTAHGVSSAHKYRCFGKKLCILFYLYFC